MIYEFRSRAAPTVIMTQPVAEAILAVIGKAAGPQGIITAEQMPAAIAALEHAVHEERSRRVSPPESEDSGSGRGLADEESVAQPTLSQRAYPFLDMLRTAHRAGKPVTWGV